MRVDQNHFLANANLNANVTTDAMQLDSVFGTAIQAVYTTSGTLAGTFKLQCSVDHLEDTQGNVISAGNWVDITDSSYTINSAGSYVWNLVSPMYPWVRLVYTRNGSDTGTLNVWKNVKGF